MSAPINVTVEITERFQMKVSKKTQTCENIQSRILADQGEKTEKNQTAAGNKIVMENVRHL